jgi:hypothetical protein
MVTDPNDEKNSAPLQGVTTRPTWVTPELMELNIWSDTLGSNVALIGDNALTRITPAS